MRCSGCGRNAVDVDRLLVTTGINSARRATIITNTTPTNRRNRYHACREYSEHTTSRHSMAIHFHRLPNLQQLSTRD